MADYVDYEAEESSDEDYEVGKKRPADSEDDDEEEDEKGKNP